MTADSRSGPRPPRVAAALVRALPAPDAAFIAADMAQEFDDMAATHGVRAARRWYWKQAFLSAPPLIRRRLFHQQPAGAGLRARLDALGRDLRYGWRVARRAPLVALSVVAAVALGIAATTAIFSVMESVFLRPLPFPRPDRLVRLSTRIEGFGVAPEVNFLDARDVRAASTHLETVAVYDADTETVRVGPDGSRFAATVISAGAGLDEVLGVRAVLGRGFVTEEHRYGGPPAVMVAYRFWRTHLGGDPTAIGRSVQVGTTWHRVVGVLPAAADRFPAGGSDLWVPLTFPDTSFLNQRGSIALSAIARLRPGVTPSLAREELSLIVSRLAAAYPETNRQRSLLLDNLQDTMVGPVRPMLLLIAGSIAALLAVACANIANLLLAQAHGRGLELGIRAAVGASRGRLVAQVWTETLALFGIGGVLGIAGALPLARVLVSLYPEALPLAQAVELDGRVMVIAVATTLGAALIAGVPLARRTRSAGTAADLQTGPRSGLTRAHRRTTTMFVAAQVALSMVLLFGGVLLLRTFITLSRTAPGFDADHVVTIRASLPMALRRTPVQTADTQDALRDAARSLPGVTGAAHAMFIPFAPGSWGDGYRRAGSTDAPPHGPMAHFFMVSPEYLGVMGLPVLRGRGLTAADNERGLRVLVVSETFARRAFPGKNAIGQRIEWNEGTWEIVGVTADARHDTLWSALDADVYVSRRQVVRGNTWLLVKTARPAAAILAELQERTRGMDPDLALTGAQTLRDRLRDSAAPERFRAIVTGTLAALTLVLAVLGLHGVVAYAVAQRTREIGVRIALGQPPASVVRLVIADTLRTIAAGAVPGAIASIYAGRWLASTVMVNADLPSTLAAVALVFAVAAVVAAAGPAWRASHVDPIEALRAG